MLTTAITNNLLVKFYPKLERLLTVSCIMISHSESHDATVNECKQTYIHYGKRNTPRHRKGHERDHSTNYSFHGYITHYVHESIITVNHKAASERLFPPTYLLHLLSFFLFFSFCQVHAAHNFSGFCFCSFVSSTFTQKFHTAAPIHTTFTDYSPSRSENHGSRACHRAHTHTLTTSRSLTR